MFLSILTPNTAGGGGLLPSLRGRLLVQGWASASLELSLFGQLVPSCLGPGKGVQGPLSQTSRGALELRPSCTHPHCPLVRAQGPVAEEPGEQGLFLPRVRLSSCTSHCTKRWRCKCTHPTPLTVTHSTKLNSLTHTLTRTAMHTCRCTESDTHQSRLHSITHAYSHSPNGQGWARPEPLGTGTGWPRQAVCGQGSLRSAAPAELAPLPLGLP